MTITNYNHVHHTGTGAGVITTHATVLPPGFGKVFYVGTQRHDNHNINSRRFNTLSAALLNTVANRGDVVLVLPGHAENIANTTMLTNLKAGVKIAAADRSAAPPTFTFSAAAGSWLLDDAGVTLEGLRFDLTGAGAAVTRGLYVTAADVRINGCQFHVASGASAKATIVLEASAAAHRLAVSGCFAWGTAAQNVTNGFLVSGAADGTYFGFNRFQFSATAANGCINYTAAATNLLVERNVCNNTHTSSTAAIAVGNVAATGDIVSNTTSVLNNGTANAQGVVLGAAALVKCHGNTCSDEARASGVLSPAAVAT